MLLDEIVIAGQENDSIYPESGMIVRQTTNPMCRNDLATPAGWQTKDKNMITMKFLADRKEEIDLPQSLQIKSTTKRFEFLLAVQRDDWNFEESSPASKVKEVKIAEKEVMDFIDVWDN